MIKPGRYLVTVIADAMIEETWQVDLTEPLEEDRLIDEIGNGPCLNERVIENSEDNRQIESWSLESDA